MTAAQKPAPVFTQRALESMSLMIANYAISVWKITATTKGSFVSTQDGYEKLIKAASELSLMQLMGKAVGSASGQSATGSAREQGEFMHATVLKVIAGNVREGAEALSRELQARQAKIDQLMLEFCPSEMTPEQKSNWARHQRTMGSSSTTGASNQLDADESQGVADCGPVVSLSLTGRQVMDVLTFVAPDCFQVINKDSEVAFARKTYEEEMEAGVTIGRFAERKGAEGEAMPAGLYAWLTDQPGEGRILMGSWNPEVDVAYPIASE